MSKSKKKPAPKRKFFNDEYDRNKTSHKKEKPFRDKAKKKFTYLD